MLTGRVPFEADSTVGIVMKHIESPVPLVSDSWPSLPTELDPVIAKAMAKAPSERYQTAHDLTVAVAEALGTSVLTGPILTRPLGRVHRDSLWSGSRTRPTLWRKLTVLGKYSWRRLRGREEEGETLAALFQRLFPTRRQRTMVWGSLLLSVVAVFSCLSLLGGLSSAAAPQPAASRTASNALIATSGPGPSTLLPVAAATLGPPSPVPTADPSTTAVPAVSAGTS